MRLWWMAMIGSLTSSHLLALAVADRRAGVDRLAQGGALLCGAAVAAMALRPGVSLNLPPWHAVLIALPGLASAIGSIVVWRRWARRDGPPRPWPGWARTAWLSGGFAATFAAGWYLGSLDRAATPYEYFPSALAGLPPEEVESLVRADVDRLRSAARALDELHGQVDRLVAEIGARQAAENRTYYRPDEDDRIRWAFVSYLSLRAALHRLIATYASFQAVRDPELRARCFQVGHGAAVVAFRHALDFVWRFRDNPPVRRKLNEAEPVWNLKSGTFEDIYQSVADPRNVAKIHESAAWYEANREAWRAAGLWPEETAAWLDGRIQADQAYVRTHEVGQARALLSRLSRRLRSDAYRPVYAAQTALSTLIGDLRTADDAPLITREQVEALRPRLQPGDILLERRNWYLSNAFLPGFWPHGALYVGTIDDLRRLGIADHPEVRSRLALFTTTDAHGERPCVIESVSEGVIFNTLSHSLHADHVAVLRPRLSPEQIAQAVVRAFTHQGKPYDFEFDFFTTDKLVCTELVYRAYEGFLRFPLVRVMGRDTLPALEIVRKFAAERPRDDRELDFVAFIDGDPADGTARERDVEALCSTLDRPGTLGR